MNAQHATEAIAPAIPGLRWHEDGQADIGGPLLALFRQLDARFASWARAMGGEERRFAPLIAARDLERAGWIESFPQLATFAVTLDPDPIALRRFKDSARCDEHGRLALSGAQAPAALLAPAACHAVYVALAGQELSAPRVITTLATCWRREAEHVPLQRQWSFSMREIVVLGTCEEARESLLRCERFVVELARELDLPVALVQATDPFFSPMSSPGWIMQRLEPVKRELAFEGRLAIASLNVHHAFFGEAFGISRDGMPAFSACAAFGLERWLHAIVTRHGVDPSGWPEIAS
jgi:hypothetical protein